MSLYKLQLDTTGTQFDLQLMDIMNENKTDPF